MTEKGPETIGSMRVETKAPQASKQGDESKTERRWEVGREEEALYESETLFEDAETEQCACLTWG